jgi:hypothetical protein
VNRLCALLVCVVFAGTAVDACLFGCEAPSESRVHRSCHDQGQGAGGLRVLAASAHCSHDHGAAAFEPILVHKGPRLADPCAGTLVGRLDAQTVLSSFAAHTPPHLAGLRPAPGATLNLPLLI